MFSYHGRKLTVSIRDQTQFAAQAAVAAVAAVAGNHQEATLCLASTNLTLIGSQKNVLLHPQKGTIRDSCIISSDTYRLNYEKLQQTGSSKV